MDRSTHSPSDRRLLPHVLNLWFSRFNRNHPLLADDCYNACVGSPVSWEKMFIFAAVKTQRFSALKGDWFGSGFEGSEANEQVVNAAIAWEEVDSIEELKGTDEATLKSFDSLWRAWTIYRDQYLEGLADDPLPEPEKPKPAPVPVPAPIPQQPVPTPVPVPAPQPTPVPEKTPLNWKKIAGMVGLGMSTISAAAYVFLPVWGDAAYKLVMELLIWLGK